MGCLVNSCLGVTLQDFLLPSDVPMAASNQHRACPRLLASHSKHVFFFFFRYACIHVYVDVYCVYVFVYMSLYVSIYVYGVIYVLWHNGGTRGRASG